MVQKFLVKFWFNLLCATRITRLCMTLFISYRDEDSAESGNISESGRYRLKKQMNIEWQLCKQSVLWTGSKTSWENKEQQEYTLSGNGATGIAFQKRFSDTFRVDRLRFSRRAARYRIELCAVAQVIVARSFARSFAIISNVTRFMQEQLQRRVWTRRVTARSILPGASLECNSTQLPISGSLPKRTVDCGIVRTSGRMDQAVEL